MMRTILGAVLMLLTLALVPQASAASFDCSKAATAFEKAICDNPELSSADETLATAFATAAGGLSKAADTALRTDQHAWLDFAAKSCTDDAAVLPDSSSYTAEQVDCLVTAFSTRVSTLEDSRMLGGYRFTIASRFNALPDPDAANDPGYYWKVATHTVAYPQLDGDDAIAPAFNSVVKKAADDANGTMVDGGDIMTDAQSDSTIDLSLAEVVNGRITLKVETYWFGHGAAHGNWSVGYLHYLAKEGRPLQAEDLFTGKGWQKTLTQLSLAELKKEHGDNLQLDDSSDISGSVTDPSRWSFDDDYGLTIQFEPYEVASYAYGAPKITLSWDSLTDILASGADAIRYGG